MDDIDKVVAGLTKAQREAFPLLPVEPATMISVGVSRVTRDRLVEKGLMHKKSPASGFGMVRWWLSPAGLAVRQRLIERREG